MLKNLESEDKKEREMEEKLEDEMECQFILFIPRIYSQKDLTHP